MLVVVVVVVVVVVFVAAIDVGCCGCWRSHPRHPWFASGGDVFPSVVINCVVVSRNMSVSWVWMVVWVWVWVDGWKKVMWSCCCCCECATVEPLWWCTVVVGWWCYYWYSFPDIPSLVSYGFSLRVNALRVMIGLHLKIWLELKIWVFDLNIWLGIWLGLYSHDVLCMVWRSSTFIRITDGEKFNHHQWSFIRINDVDSSYSFRLSVLFRVFYCLTPLLSIVWLRCCLPSYSTVYGPFLLSMALLHYCLWYDPRQQLRRLSTLTVGSTIVVVLAVVGCGGGMRSDVVTVVVVVVVAPTIRTSTSSSSPCYGVLWWGVVMGIVGVVVVVIVGRWMLCLIRICSCIELLLLHIIDRGLSRQRGGLLLLLQLLLRW